MAQEGDVEQDLSHIHWSWPEAVAANPARSLATADLAMDYFAYSPFFDTKSNNSVLRTQRRVENPAYGHAEEKFELNAFRSGFEYIVAHSQPPDLFVIHKRDVQADGSRQAVSAAYFILQEKVYPTPTLYGVMAARLRNASHLVSTTFSTLSAAHPPANPRATTQWRSLPPSVPTDPSSSAEKGGPQAEDIDMAETAPGAEVPPHQVLATKKKSTTKMPDFHLFNALQSTRNALNELQTLSTRPAEKRDPRAELRAIEAEILGGDNTISGRIGRRTGEESVADHARVVGTPLNGSVRLGGSPLMTMSIGGRAPSVSASGVGQSPLAMTSHVV